MPKIAYKEKAFRQDALGKIQLVNEIIEDYHQQGYELTLRQVYYQLVARGYIENTERSYKNLGSVINEGRLCGLIDWNAIVDRTRNLRTNSHWSTPSSVINSAANSYNLDRWINQDTYVEVWVEKDALVGIVGQICRTLDVPHFSCRGYVSQSEMWTAGQRIGNKNASRKVILHLGDHDPSGVDMSRDIQDRLTMFGADVEVKRIALTMAQIEEFSPPPNPTKLTDARAKGYVEKYGYKCWELDALEPKVITDLIRKEVSDLIEWGAFNEIASKEKEDLKILHKISNNYDEIEAFVEDNF